MWLDCNPLTLTAFDLLVTWCRLNPVGCYIRRVSEGQKRTGSIGQGHNVSSLPHTLDCHQNHWVSAQVSKGLIIVLRYQTLAFCYSKTRGESDAHRISGLISVVAGDTTLCASTCCPPEPGPSSYPRLIMKRSESFHIPAFGSGQYSSHDTCRCIVLLSPFRAKISPKWSPSPATS